MYYCKYRMYDTILHFEGRGATSVIFAPNILLERLIPFKRNKVCR